MEQRDYFSFSSDYWQLIVKVPEGEQLAMMKAVVMYGLYREDTTFNDPLLAVVWLAIRQRLEKGWSNATNGKKGGAPIGNKNGRKATEIQPPLNTPSTEIQPPLHIEIEKEQEKEKNIYIYEDEVAKFEEELKQFTPTYGRDFIYKFYLNWKEPTKSGKMRKDEEKTWDTATRLAIYKENLQSKRNGKDSD